ncbi:MAG: hypothetical protein RL685_2185 [Pseudomonadota bacterium]
MVGYAASGGSAAEPAASGARLRQVAQTLARELAEREGSKSGVSVRLRAVESQRDLLRELGALPVGSLRELHLVTPGSVYGPVLGTPEWPEQLSRHEWRQLRLPFAPGARAVFHFSHSGRWFAPFFAHTFGVEALGAAGELGLSSSPERRGWLSPGSSPQAPLYLQGALQSYLPEPAGFQASDVAAEGGPGAGRGAGYDAGYDSVASLYDAAFADIRVRADEWGWLDARLRSSQPLRVVDVGCGNGALLCQLAPRLSQGLGVDVSAPMVELAGRNAKVRGYAQRLCFSVVTGPLLPLADQSVDRVLSLLSFRYLDWEPVRREVQRVLSPGGRWLIVDMVHSRCALAQLPALVSSKLRTLAAARRHPHYRAALRRLVGEVGWQHMLAQHPMRSEQEVSRYLSSRFPRGRWEVLNVGRQSKVLAFDSGPLETFAREQG